MITGCLLCGTKTRQIDASVYAGDYHSPPADSDYAPARQCVECGAIMDVTPVGKTVRLSVSGVAYVPPRNQWREPLK